MVFLSGVGGTDGVGVLLGFARAGVDVPDLLGIGVDVPDFRILAAALAAREKHGSIGKKIQ